MMPQKWKLKDFKKLLPENHNLRMLADIKQKKLGNETMYAVVIGDYSSKASAENAKIIVQQQCKCIPIIFEK